MVRNINQPKRDHYWLTLLCLMLFMLGCAEGALWRTGHLSPWARNRWAEEEKVADTLFSKRRKMEEQVAQAQSGTPEQRQRVAGDLTEIVRQDSVLLIRLHAVRLLGRIESPAAIEGLEIASRDYNADVRMAAIEAWQFKTGDAAVPQLQRLLANDTNVDVRLAATRALGNFSQNQVLDVLELALNDSDPALQLAAAESLRSATGKPFGRDITAWQDFIAQNRSTPPITTETSSETRRAQLPGSNDFLPR